MKRRINIAYFTGKSYIVNDVLMSRTQVHNLTSRQNAAHTLVGRADRILRQPEFLYSLQVIY